MQKLILALAAAALAVLALPLMPTSIRTATHPLVAMFGPGSASDTICRVIAQPLSLALKESVIVENDREPMGRSPQLRRAIPRPMATRC